MTREASVGFLGRAAISGGRCDAACPLVEGTAVKDMA